MEYSIEDRIAIVRENIEKAAGCREVTLVGVAKTKPAELVRRAVAVGTVRGVRYVDGGLVRTKRNEGVEDAESAEPRIKEPDRSVAARRVRSALRAHVSTSSRTRPSQRA